MPVFVGREAKPYFAPGMANLLEITRHNLLPECLRRSARQNHYFLSRQHDGMELAKLGLWVVHTCKRTTALTGPFPDNTISDEAAADIEDIPRHLT